MPMMFLYYARARAPRKEASSAQLGTRFGFIGASRSQKPKETNQKVNVYPSKTTKKDNHICQTQVFGPRTWVWARCGHFWLFWERFKPEVFSCKRAPKQPTKTTSGPNPGFRAQNLGLGQMWSFWVVLRRVYTKSFHIWPKPTVDVATFHVNTVQNNLQRPHLAQTQVFGPRTWVWARCGHLGLFCEGGLSLAFGFCFWGVSLAICVLLMSG